MTFKGSFAVVTGGGSGIGEAVTRELAGRGARVLIVGRRHGELIALQEELGRSGKRIVVHPGDVSSAQSMESLAEVIRAETEQVDHVVHNAGIYLKAPFGATEERDWDSVFDINVKGIFLLTKLLLPLMNRAGGSIVTIASTLAYQTVPGVSAYAASKAAVVSLTRSMAREFAGEGIRVNCICPGVVDTPVHEPFFSRPEDRKRFVEEMARAVPLGRIGSPEDIARAVAFLLGGEASWITGAVLAVDGGMSIA